MAVQVPDWVKDAVFYQIFPDRFAHSERIAKPSNLESWDSTPTRYGFKGGDLLGIAEHLSYLEELGITAIYLNPIFQSTANHRYHTHDYFRVDPILGGDEAFRYFLDAAHDRGMRVVLDGVFNHASRGFLQFNDILENGEASPYLDWFIVKGFPLRPYDGKKKANYESWWNNRALPKLNTDNPQVSSFIFDVAEYWLKQGIDGWRLDVPLEIKTPGFWEEFRRRVKRLNPDAYILAEIWEEARPWLQGEHFDAVMNYPFNRACYGFFGGEMLVTSVRPGGFKLKRMEGRTFARQIDRILTLYDWDVTMVQYNLLSSHDEPRFLTMVGGDKQRLRLATLFQMTFPGTPSIYYGDEIGLDGGEDPECRRAFPWDEAQWDLDLLADFRRFVTLRKEHSALRRGCFAALYAGDDAYAFARSDDTETVVVAFNLSDKPEDLTLNMRELMPDDASLTGVWSSSAVQVTGGQLNLSLLPMSAQLLIYAP